MHQLPQCVIARRSAYNPTERRCLTAGAESDGSRRVFHAVPQDRNHLNKSRKRECGQQKPETPLHLHHILRGVPREKARREPVVSAPPSPRRCLAAALLPCCLTAASPPPCCPAVALPLPSKAPRFHRCARHTHGLKTQPHVSYARTSFVSRSDAQLSASRNV